MRRESQLRREKIGGRIEIEEYYMQNRVPCKGDDRKLCIDRRNRYSYVADRELFRKQTKMTEWTNKTVRLIAILMYLLQIADAEALTRKRNYVCQFEIALDPGKHPCPDIVLLDVLRVEEQIIRRGRQRLRTLVYPPLICQGRMLDTGITVTRTKYKVRKTRRHLKLRSQGSRILHIERKPSNRRNTKAHVFVSNEEQGITACAGCRSKHYGRCFSPSNKVKHHRGAQS